MSLPQFNSGSSSDSSHPVNWKPTYTPTAYVPPTGAGLSPTGSTSPAKKPSGQLAQRVKPALITVGALAAVMIIIQVINWSTDYRLDQYGIEPRTWSGLLGVLFAPLLH